jgi:hypothetical protein
MKGKIKSPGMLVGKIDVQIADTATNLACRFAPARLCLRDPIRDELII